MYSADATVVSVCVAHMVETVHLGRSQEKALVPDFTPRPERKTLYAQATC